MTNFITNNKNRVHYNVGLDIGTNSVGWAVTDANTGEVLKFKAHNMMGSRLFEAGSTAKERRIYRSVRRRYNRRRERVQLLRQLMQKDILGCDENFYRRLDESFLYLEDKSIEEKHILFNDINYTDKEYYDQYKTIYHLRKELYNSDEKKDIRLIYLALHNLVKYRGHFLYQGQNFSEVHGSLKELFSELFEELTEKCNYLCDYYKGDFDSVESVLKDNNLSRKEKQEKILRYLEGTMDTKRLIEIAKIVLGNVADFTVIFNDDKLQKDGKNLKLSFSDVKYEEIEDEILDSLNEKSTILEKLKKIYSWYILQNVLQGENTIAAAMVKKYDKHTTDLKMLKRIIKEYCTTEQYTNFFRKEYDTSNKYLKNYVNYIAGEKRCSREEFYKSVKVILEVIHDDKAALILKDIENETFMPLLNSKDNSAIPYQLTYNEAKKILDNQGIYYPALTENKEKILSLISFRIPYYVGPMNTNSSFSWIERRSMDKIYPWNFKDIVDVDKTAENFILRMTNKCTYLVEEDVIPRYSILYSTFVLFNELNKVKINGKFIAYKDKMDIIRNVFLKYKNVKETQLIKYLKSINYQNTKDYTIEGYQKEKEFASSMTAYIDMAKIFGCINADNYDMVEKIIFWVTIFEEKEIVKRKISFEYGDKVSEEQLNKICKLRYKGWSRLSEKLLKGIKTELSDGSKVSIVDILEKTNLNFMQVINDKKYGFDKLIAKENAYNTLDSIQLEDVNSLAGSPAIKRGIWQTVRIINEIVEIMGHDPDNIFIEFAREEQEKERTTTRQNRLKKCFKVLKEETEEYNKTIEEYLKDSKYSEKLDSERLFLYFLQNGKCMYSGEALDIDSLSLYQVDHIVPQAYIKDDSIDNKVLVKAELNQYKSDKLLLSAETRKRQFYYWSNLYKAGLMSAKKYNNLRREAISDNERKGFINRQLVETRQISKHVAELFVQRFANSKVVTIRAELSHNFRQKYELYKSREINDFHHAHDAFLAAEIGGFLIRKFPGLESELIYNEFTNYYRLGNKAQFLKEKWGYILGLLDKRHITEDGEVIWNGSEDIAYIKSVLYSNDCRVTKKLEELTGEFYNETVYRKDSDKKDMRPRKINLPAEKYGGYSGKNMAYYVVVKYAKGRKSVKKLLGIPVYINALQKTKQDAIKQYIAEELGTTDFAILKEHILKNQLVIENGSELYLVSDAEVVNAKQFFFGDKYKDHYSVLTKALSNNVRAEEKVIIGKYLSDIYDYIINKSQKQYRVYEEVFDKIEKCIQFDELEYDDKIFCIKEMLKLLRANSECANMAKFNEKSCCKSIKLIDRMGRKSKYHLDVENTIFVDQSITGLYERRYKI